MVPSHVIQIPFAFNVGVNAALIFLCNVCTVYCHLIFELLWILHLPKGNDLPYPMSLINTASICFK